MSLSLIAAISTNGCIGKDGRLPWHLPEDMARFKILTMGKVVLMGRKTWDSIPEKFRPLPGRTNVILSRHIPSRVSPPYESKRACRGFDGAARHSRDGEVFGSLDAALQAFPDGDIMVIGGAELYRQTIDLADRLFLTRVDQTVDGDAFFPNLDMTRWQLTDAEPHPGFVFETYARR